MTLDPRAIAELERLLADVSMFIAEDAEEVLSECDVRFIAAAHNLLPDLLRERRELRARVLEEMALRVGTSDVIDPMLAANWNNTREGRWAERRAVCLLRHYADGIRAGRIK